MKHLKIKACFISIYCIYFLSYSQEYQKIKIGNQIWMANNLNLEVFQNGDTIFHAKSEKEWEEAGKNKQAAWCYYQNDSLYGAKFGKLYNWFAVNDPRGLSPKGWHIPTILDFEILTDYFKTGNLQGGKTKLSTRKRDKMKVLFGTPGNYRENNGKFSEDMQAFWWTADIDKQSKKRAAWAIDINRVGGGFYMEIGFSVRCIKD